MALLKEHPEIKIIASSRKYAIDLITLKFGIDKNETKIIDIPTLDEVELKLVSDKFPQLNSVLKNDKVKKLLQSPKYLDFSILAISKTKDDYANVSLTEFKDNLWNSLVVDSTTTKNGLPIKREAAFMEIAVKRAKEMKLFTKAEKSDAEAIVYLVNDEIVFQENQNRKYSPTHDILEDWALVKYVSSKFEEHPKPNDFFSNLGNEPAIRRAFRLWVEDSLIDNSSKINDFFKTTISNQTIEKYWADELLVAAFKSENSNSFFTAFETNLLNNNAVFFNRCLHIIKTCCKENDPKAINSNLLLPVGSGWKEAMFFIQKNIAQLDTIKLSIINFIIDWYYRLLLQYNTIENEELEAVKLIVLHYLKENEEEQLFWQEENAKNKSKELITILLDLAEISKEEIKQLVARAFANKENRESWRLNSFYENVIKNCLTGIGNQRLIKEMPELVVETAWKHWKYIQPKENEFPNEIRFIARQSLRDEECWGIRDKHSFFPSGIYKTPVYNLLIIHPIIGLKFITDFINYSVEFYVKTDCEYKHKVSKIEIELNDGTIIKKWASGELWAAYRGLSVTNYALESMLMSLEKYLLETAAIKTGVSKKNLKFIFDYILRNSNNVAPLAVLASVTTAYPEEVEEAMLPLLSVREFYEWDLSRAIKESSSLAPMDNQISFSQEERWKSNQLPHRKKFQRGLSDFIVNYQFNIRKLNPQIHSLFDKLQRKIKDDDVIWKKRLNEIDIRKWEVQPYDKKLGGFVVQPKYEKEVVDLMAFNQDFFEAQNTEATYSGLISKAYEKQETISYEKWVECYKYYSNTENLNFLRNRPVTLAILGLNEFLKDISEEQKNWCLEELSESIITILQDTFSRNYELSKGFNLMEKDIALSSFHLLMQNLDEDDKNEIIALMIYMLIAPFTDHEIDKITQYVREIFFKNFPDEAKRVWLGLIKYSIYRKANPHFHSNHDENRLKIEKENEKKFVLEISTDKNIKLDLSEISLKQCESYLLARAFVIMPYDTTDKNFSDFTNHVLPIVLDDLTKEEDYSYNKTIECRQFHHESIFNIEQYLANLLLSANLEFSKIVLTTLVNSLSKFSKNRRFGRNDQLEFIDTTLDYVVLKLYDNSNLNIDQKQYAQQLTNFWNLWEILFNLLPENNNHPLTKKLLLDIRYLLFDFRGNPNKINWSALNGKSDFYKKSLLERGINFTSSAINVFSTIGGQDFLPEGVSWLVEIFKSDLNASMSLTTSSAERMIKQLFYNHISKIKNDKSLIDGFIWILNRMVDLGSSDAYIFRENVITYKTSAI